jgi:hypothetical protein
LALANFSGFMRRKKIAKVSRKPAALSSLGIRRNWKDSMDSTGCEQNLEDWAATTG